MKARIYNLNNNDVPHEIFFQALTIYASGAKTITVSFDGVEYTAPLLKESSGYYFKRCGKVYNVEVVL
jgi:hypothetical protein